MKNLKTKLSILTSMATALFLLILCYISYRSSRDAMLTQITSRQNTVLNNAMSQIKAFENNNIKSASDLKDTILALPMGKNSYTRGTRGKLPPPPPLLQYFRQGGVFLAVYIGLDNGKVISNDVETNPDQTNRVYGGGGDSGYMATQRGWYQNALNTNGVIQQTPIKTLQQKRQYSPMPLS